MPELESSFEGTQEFAALPEATYEARVDAVMLNFNVIDGRLVVEAKEGKSTNPSARLKWKISGGEFSDRTLSEWAHLLMIGGTTKEGKPMPLFRLIEFLENTDTPYSCAVNGCNLTQKKVYRGTGKDGKKVGTLYCPTCESELRLKYNTNDFAGRRAKIVVKTEPDQTGSKEVNKVEKVLPLS
jgi:hypothetical protein